MSIPQHRQLRHDAAAQFNAGQPLAAEPNHPQLSSRVTVVALNPQSGSIRSVVECCCQASIHQGQRSGSQGGPASRVGETSVHWYRRWRNVCARRLLIAAHALLCLSQIQQYRWCKNKQKPTSCVIGNRQLDDRIGSGRREYKSDSKSQSRQCQQSSQLDECDCKVLVCVHITDALGDPADGSVCAYVR